jgi:hypothetical protein
MGKASTLVDLLTNAGVEPSPELFDEMCRERGIHPAFSVAYAARGNAGVFDLGLALWAASGEPGRD